MNVSMAKNPATGGVTPPRGDALDPPPALEAALDGALDGALSRLASRRRRWAWLRWAAGVLGLAWVLMPVAMALDAKGPQWPEVARALVAGAAFALPLLLGLAAVFPRRPSQHEKARVAAHIDRLSGRAESDPAAALGLGLIPVAGGPESPTLTLTAALARRAVARGEAAAAACEADAVAPRGFPWAVRALCVAAVVLWAVMLVVCPRFTTNQFIRVAWPWTARPPHSETRFAVSVEPVGQGESLRVGVTLAGVVPDRATLRVFPEGAAARAEPMPRESPGRHALVLPAPERPMRAWVEAAGGRSEAFVLPAGPALKLERAREPPPGQEIKPGTQAEDSGGQGGDAQSLRMRAWAAQHEATTRQALALLERWARLRGRLDARSTSNAAAIDLEAAAETGRELRDLAQLAGLSADGLEALAAGLSDAGLQAEVKRWTLALRAAGQRLAAASRAWGEGPGAGGAVSERALAQSLAGQEEALRSAIKALDAAGRFAGSGRVSVQGGAAGEASQGNAGAGTLTLPPEASRARRMEALVDESPAEYRDLARAYLRRLSEDAQRRQAP